MLVIRSATSLDTDAFIQLARSTGPGFTSLMVDDDTLHDRLSQSERAFQGSIADSCACNYQLMLEDTQSRKILGTSAIKAAIGTDKPYYDFKLVTIAQKSESAARRFDMDALLLTNDFSGATEVGSLFVADGLRGTGAGRLCAQSRYLLMAADPNLFGQTVLAELRGVSDENGHSPFYEALAKKFLRMEFTQADELSARTDNQFIKDLIPSSHLFVEMLPESAKAVIGKTHPDGANALRLLQSDGFGYDRYVDIFDGGPLVSCPIGTIKTIKHSHIKVISGTHIKTPCLALISTDRLDDFRCVFTHIGVQDQSVQLDDETRNALNMTDGDTVRIWIKN